MHLSRYAITPLLLLTSLSLAADNNYQTAPKPTVTQSQPSWSSPLISVDPVTQQTRVYIQPDGSFSNNLASYGAPVYHAASVYEPTPQGIAASQQNLHQQMHETCPLGWIKLQEWAQLNQEPTTLNYQFQCLKTTKLAPE